MIYRWRRTIAAALLLISVITIGVFSVRYVLQKDEPDDMRKKTFQFQENSRTPPDSSDDERAVPDRLIGHIRPVRETTVSAPVSGTLQSVNVRAGQVITSDMVPDHSTANEVIELDGRASNNNSDKHPALNLPPYSDNQVLARLDTQKITNRLEEMNAQIQKTRLQLRDARRTEKRIRKAFDEGGEGTVYSTQDLDDAVLNVNVTKNELNRLRARRNRLAEEARDHFIHAPYPGVVRSVHAEVGEWVSPGQPVFTLMDVDRIKVVFHVTEHLEPVIRNQNQFSFSVDAYPDQTNPFNGTVYSISPATDSDRHQFKVVLSLSNPENTPLKPGMICRVHLDTNSN